DSLYLISSPSKEDNRNVLVYSDLINISLDGRFDLAKVVPAFKNLIYEEHPKWADKLGINKPTANLTNDQKFRFKINVKDTKDYLELANVNDLRFKFIAIEGSAGLKDNEYETVISIDTSYYRNFVFNKVGIESGNKNGQATLDLNIDTILSGNKIFEPIAISTSLSDNVIDVSLKTQNILDSVGRVDVGFLIEPIGDKTQFKVRNNDLDMFGSSWSVLEDNRVLLGKDYIEIDSLVFSDGYRSIAVSDYLNRGIEGHLSNFDFLIINGLIDYDKIQFAGEGDVNMSIDSIFGQPIINGLVDIPKFTLNGEDYGRLLVKATDKNQGFVNTLVTLNNPNNGMNVYVEADFEKQAKKINGKVNIDDLPLDIFEFIIEDGISLTSGTTNIDASIYGPLDDLILIGEGRLNDAATRINYLGNYITLGNQPIAINNNAIDFSKVIIEDKFGNTGSIEGGLVHTLFKDFELDVVMISDNFLALDTDKSDNPLYYGQGMGEIEVSFLGPIHTADIEVTAVMGKGTTLNIPIEDSYEDFDESFIKFVDRKALDKDTLQDIYAVTLEGVDIEMNLSITEAAQVNIIFDEKTNDVIRGNGVGDMRIVVTREGDFNVFGDYEVFNGEYLFTAWGIVAKPFNVRRGGTITWTGDPVNANINIEADYEDLRVPTNIFLQEYLVTGNQDLLLQSRKRTSVDLTLDLTGTLYKPIVNFDIKFPELQGELRTFADAKLRSLKENEADLNEQVAGLIIFRSFLPSNRFGNVITTGNAVVETGYNTLSEFVSNQLSYLLSSILQEALTENGFVSGIDFEIGISRNAGLLANAANNNYFPDEIEVHFKPRFQNDKWGLDYGTSFVNANNAAFGITNYVIHDVALEYFLTDDKRLKLRAYGKWDKDEVQFQNEQKYGLGVNYRKEFGSLLDFKNDIEAQMSRINNTEEN
ncbi:translocation/assembly module TamB, partial [Saprospiraceae bacterium]|nr:translocation/assembly module TamB [Saprospiraceae bacterium]